MKFEKIPAAFERLESRLMLSDTTPDAVLTLNNAPLQITPALFQGKDSNGKFFSTPEDKLAAFNLPSANNAMTLQVAAADTGTSGATGDLSITIIRDTNGNGLLDATERSTPVVQRNVTDQSQTTLNLTLPKGGYFALLQVVNFNLHGQGGVIEADVQATLQGVAAPVTAPDVGLKGPNGKAILPNSAATAANGTDFGTHAVGSIAGRQMFTVTNTGGANLNLGPVFVPAGFQLVSGLPPVLAAGTSGSFVVQLKTAVAGSFSGNIHFTTGVAGKDPFMFGVRGVVGTPPPPTVGSISGSVFDDYNHNGRQDPGDIPLAGRQVYIDLHNLGRYAAGDPTTSTDKNGSYQFVNIKLGAYLVREVPAQGWKLFSPRAGAYTVAVVAGRNSGPFAFAEAAPASTPFGKAPFTVKYGAVLEAENFDNGAEGVAYHDTEPQNLGGAYRAGGVDIERFFDGSGFFVGFIRPTEWLNYTVNVQAAGLYTLGFRFRPVGNGLAGNATFHLEVDGINVTGSISVPTGPFTFTSLAKTGIRLSAGRHVLRIFFDSAAPKQGYLGNFDSITFSK